MKKNFKYVVLLVVLFIPFIYSFFYLKAYWNPYGKGNIDNIPVAIINSDRGDKGSKLVKSIKKSKKLKISVVSDKKGNDGLNKGNYYAVITIPEDFSSSMESISTNNKKHPTITYSPNQKSNYLASQIINSVVNAVEKKLDNEINSNIVDSLSEKVESVPDNLDTISTGFGKLKDGTNKLTNGSSEILNGTNSLKNNYDKFNQGINDINDGSNTLASSVGKLDEGIEKLSIASSGFSELTNSLGELVTGVSQLKSGSDGLKARIGSYTSGVNLVISSIQSNCQTVSSPECIRTITVLNMPLNNIIAVYNSDPTTHGGINDTLYNTVNAMVSSNQALGNVSLLTVLQGSGNDLNSGANTLNGRLTVLNSKVSQLNAVPEKINALQSGISELKDGSTKLRNGANTLANGTNALYNSSLKLQGGIGKLNTGVGSLNNGLYTLDSSVATAKLSLDNKINDTKKQVKKVEKLKDYSKEPVKINTKEVNKVSSYGTAFSPLFISVGLWVGCLMMFMVFYYDKEERFEILGIKNSNRIQRMAAYHGIITISAIVLGTFLMLLLDFDITNIFLYYISIILIGNMFMAIIEFLIENFNDVGKFIALIILVLQLAASGGTFPIEAVTKGFRFMNGLLPMTYSINLIKESLIAVQTSLLTKNVLVVIILLIIFVGINFAINTYKQKNSK